MERSPSLPPDTATPDPGRAQACWRCSQQHSTCFSAHKKNYVTLISFFFSSSHFGDEQTHLHGFEDPRQFHTGPEENAFGSQFIFLAPANESRLQCVFRDVNLTRDNGTGLTAVSYLEKASFSTSSPGSTQRCRAVEKCPQATAISATSYNTDQS